MDADRDYPHNPSAIAGDADAAAARLPVIVLGGLALMQAVVVLLSGGETATRLIAVGLAGASVIVVLGRWYCCRRSSFSTSVSISFTNRSPFRYALAHWRLLVFMPLSSCRRTLEPGYRYLPIEHDGVLDWCARVRRRRRRCRHDWTGRALRSEEVRWTGERQKDAAFGHLYSPYSSSKPSTRAIPGLLRPPGKCDGVSQAAYFVTYALNAFGCRGRDYSVPAAVGTHRLLVVGNSSVFGAGVREADTFAARLETLLNSGQPPPSGRYEVINCGVKDYSTRQQRLLFEEVLYRYEADVIIAATTAADDGGNYERRKRRRP